MNTTQNITLDFAQRSIFRYLSAKQGDNSSRFVKITLTDGGAAYPVPKAVKANFRAQKPDGTMILNQAVVNDDGTVTVELTQQTLAVCGDVIADVYLTDGNGSVLSSVSFVIHVEAAPMGDKIDSENEFLTLIRLAERAEHAANTSTSASTTAVKSAQRAEAASGTAVESCARAEAAAETATEASTSAKQSCTDAGNSAQTATQAAQRAEAAKAGIVEAETAAKKSAETATQAASNATAAADRATQAASQAADKLPLAGGTMTGPVTVDTESSKGFVTITEDVEGGTIQIGSPNGTYVYEIDAPGDDEIRVHTKSSPSGVGHQQFSFSGKTGEIRTDIFSVKSYKSSAASAFEALKAMYPSLQNGIVLVDAMVGTVHCFYLVEKASNTYGSALLIAGTAFVYFKLSAGKWTAVEK